MHHCSLVKHEDSCCPLSTTLPPAVCLLLLMDLLSARLLGSRLAPCQAAIEAGLITTWCIDPLGSVLAGAQSASSSVPLHCLLARSQARLDRCQKRLCLRRCRRPFCLHLCLRQVLYQRPFLKFELFSLHQE